MVRKLSTKQAGEFEPAFMITMLINIANNLVEVTEVVTET